MNENECHFFRGKKQLGPQYCSAERAASPFPGKFRNLRPTTGTFLPRTYQQVLKDIPPSPQGHLGLPLSVLRHHVTQLTSGLTTVTFTQSTTQSTISLTKPEFRSYNSLLLTSYVPLTILYTVLFLTSTDYYHLLLHVLLHVLSARAFCTCFLRRHLRDVTYVTSPT